MRNDNNSFLEDDSTLGSTITGTTTNESRVDIGGISEEVLQVKVTARNETIGFFSPTKTTQICVNIKACELNDEEQRSPIDIVNALDVSSSMRGIKLNDCKKTIELQLRTLSSKDRFGLVTYGSATKVEIPPMFMTEENKARALQKIKAIQVSGMTNMSGGLALAAQELELIGKPNPVRSIFLLTDGHANTGVRDTPGLVAMVQNFNQPIPPSDGMIGMQIDDNAVNADTAPKLGDTIAIDNQKSPMSLFCFGYGSNHNSDMLRAISEASAGGGYYFVETDSDVSSAFGDAMGGLLSVVAQSTMVRLSVPTSASAKGVKILKVHHKEQMKREDGSFTVNVGDFYAEESRDVLLDVELSNAPSETAVSHVVVTATYMDALKKAPANIDPMECCIKRPANAETSPVDMHIEAQRLRIRAAEEMDAIDHAAQSNNLESARSQTRQLIRSFQVLPVATDIEYGPFVGQMIADAEDVLKGLESKQEYEDKGGYVTKNKRMKFRNQRCYESNETSMNSYRSSAKAKMSMKMKAAFMSKRSQTTKQPTNQVAKRPNSQTSEQPGDQASKKPKPKPNSQPNNQAAKMPNEPNEQNE